MRMLGHGLVFGALLGLVSLVPSVAEAQAKGSAGKHLAQKPAAAAPAKPKIGAPRPGPKKPAKKPVKQVESNKASKKPGSEPKPADPQLRASVAGKPIEDAAAESPELKALREVDDLLFWDIEVKAPLANAGTAPVVTATGLPPTASASTDGGPLAKGSTDSQLTREGDHRWMSQLRAPDLPFRWDVRLIRYLDYFKNNPKGQSFVAALLKRSGRYEAELRAALKKKGLPEDLVYLALAESGMNARVVSHAGAAGLWQFMPKAADAYGLRVDKWVDERLDPYRSTEAAIRYLKDLHTRFGRWELAMAAYNMGHGGLLTAIRKYNTNDFWELSQLEAGVPYETALYVPKILAIAFVARNKDVFNIGDLQLDPAEKFEVSSATSAPPAEPKAKSGTEAAKTVAASEPVVSLPPESLEKVVLRWGESLESVAAAAGTTESKLRAINNLKDPVPPRPGTEIKIPKTGSKKPPQDQPVVVVPARTTTEPGMARVFYEVVWGDKLDDVASALGVKADELCQWNNLDRTANLHGKMVLQAFVPNSKSLKNVRLIEAKDANVLTVGSEPFFEYFEAKNGRARQTVVVKEGETMGSLARKHGVTLGMMERINKRSRDAALKPGETIVVYSKKSAPEKPSKAAVDLYAEDPPSAPDIDTQTASTLQ